MNKKDNTLFYVLAVILIFVLISWMKDRNKSDKADTKNTTTEKEPDLVDPVTGDGIYLPEDYDPTHDAPVVVAPGGITATVPDKGNAVDVIKNGAEQIKQNYTI